MLLALLDKVPYPNLPSAELAAGLTPSLRLAGHDSSARAIPVSAAARKTAIARHGFPHAFFLEIQLLAAALRGSWRRHLKAVFSAIYTRQAIVLIQNRRLVMSFAGEYLVDRKCQSNGLHEVHRVVHSCPGLPEPTDWVLLGWQPDGYAAMSAAREQFARIEGCRHCLMQCATRIHRRQRPAVTNGNPAGIKI